MNRKLILGIVAALLLVVICSLYICKVATTDRSLVKILGNISYGSLYSPQIKLTDGESSVLHEDCGNKSCNGIFNFVHTKLNSNIAVGDLNGDGVNDAAVIIDHGSTPYSSDKNPKDENVTYTSQSVAAVINQNGDYKNVAFLDLSYDLNAVTTKIQKIKIKDNLIYVTVLKNEKSDNQFAPEGIEEIALQFSSSTSGFTIIKNGASEVDSISSAEIKNITVSNDGVMTITGKDFSLLKNNIVFVSKADGTEYHSDDIQSSEGNTRINIDLRTARIFRVLKGSDTTTFNGTYDVKVATYRCPPRKACETTYSNPVSVDLR